MLLLDPRCGQKGNASLNQNSTNHIIQSYRKMALKYHPDKNSQDDAKQIFIEINEAYNVLSDPNQRTFYDNNREKILFNKEEMSKQDLEQYSFGFNIWNYFTTNCFKGYQDGEGGFYAVYRDIFEKIKAEQTKAFNSREDLEQQQKKYEGFGDSTTSLQRVLKFYEQWQNFTTYKTFVWIEQWDTRDAGSRWVRREMQKQNKKQRQGQKKTYLKTIKDLLSYVKKRDPRFMEYIKQLKQQQEKKQLEKLEKEKQKKKEKQQMKVVKQRLEQQRFKEIEQYYKKQNQQANITQVNNKSYHNNNNKADEDEQSQFYCQICEKQFKSQNQLKNHQKSKQHKQMVKQIEKQVLLKEDIVQNIKQEVSQAKEPQKQQEEPSPAKKKKNKKKKNQQKKQDSQQQEKMQVPEIPQPKKEQKKQQPPKKKEVKESSSDDQDRFMNTLLNNRNKKTQDLPAKAPTKNEAKKQKQQQKPKQSSSDDEDQFMNTLLNNRNKKADIKQTVAQPEITKQDKKKKPIVVQPEESDEDETEERKLGKAKLKKQKKAQQQKSAKPAQLKCNVCNEKFPSKTRMFEHINKTGHASAK